MTHNYEHKCWSCGSQDMELDEHGVKCQKCGATWNEIPLPGHPALTYSEPDAYGNVTSKPYGAPDF